MLKINTSTPFITALIALLLLFWLEFVQATDNRVALVIGNSSYRGNAFLENVATDADNFKETLEKLHFRVIYRENLTRKEMQNAIEQFKDELQGGIGLFYFAGHGLQFEGENYLIPIGAENVFITLDKKRLERKTTKLSDILKVMQGADNRIIILDACHKNPFQELGRGKPSGLTPVKVEDGTLIAYAAKPGQVVAENNPYTKNIISEIQKPDLSITEVFLRVEAIVREKTGGQQESESESKLKVDFYFAGKSDSWLTMLFWLVILLIGGFLKILYALIKRKKVFKFDVITVNARGEEIKRTPQQAQYYTENLGNSVSLEMVSLPGGRFLMGSPETEKGRESKESPQHEVTVKSFYMGKYTVTQAQWQVIMGDNPSEFLGDNRPVDNVTYEMAEAFCKRLSKMTGKIYRLPSETEWEYACRAGTTTPFHFGETISTELANYDGDYAYALGPQGVDRHQTTEVGRFFHNAFGLYDMHGNVWEWTYGVVQRGGSWSNPPTVARSAYRLECKPSDKPKNNVGFRLVKI